MNEYFYPCFRSELEYVMKGEKAKSDYVDWYEREFERNEERKHEEQSVTIYKDKVSDKIYFELIDSYGKVIFGLEELNKILNKENEK